MNQPTDSSRLALLWCHAITAVYIEGHARHSSARASSVAESSSHSHDEIGTDDSASSSSIEQTAEPVDFHTAPDRTDSEGGVEKTATDAVQDDSDGGQDQDQNFLTCGRCKGGLSFPFWYCIFCEGWSQG